MLQVESICPVWIINKKKEFLKLGNESSKKQLVSREKLGEKSSFHQGNGHCCQEVKHLRFYLSPKLACQPSTVLKRLAEDMNLWSQRFKTLLPTAFMSAL